MQKQNSSHKTRHIGGEIISNGKIKVTFASLLRKRLFFPFLILCFSIVIFVLCFRLDGKNYRISRITICYSNPGGCSLNFKIVPWGFQFNCSGFCVGERIDFTFASLTLMWWSCLIIALTGLPPAGTPQACSSKQLKKKVLKQGWEITNISMM